jgi:hypothetical protein
MMGYAIMAIAVLLQMNASSVFAMDPCQVAAEHGRLVVPVDRLERESRCLIAEVVTRPGASTMIGPVLTPIRSELYAHLLDHPDVRTLLMQRLEMETCRFSPKGPNQFWVDDGDGAEGLLTVLYRDSFYRIYYIDGQHRSALFPTVRVKTVVFMKMVPTERNEGLPAVQVALVSYTRFESRLLTGLARMFQPLVARAVKRALAREFDLSHQLGVMIAEDPDRVRKAIASLPFDDPEDRRTFNALLETVSRTPASSLLSSP